MTLTRSVLGFGIACVSFAVSSAAADPIPDLSFCYYTPEAGSTANPIQGTNAIPFFRMCPNNDGGSSLPNNARLKIRLRDINGNPIVGVSPDQVDVIFNGGTPQQGFSGIGADSIIANTQYNPTCPDVRYIQADVPTDANGFTYITFTGSTPGSPGVGTRDAARKWGHYDSDWKVYALGFRISGAITPGAPNGTYFLQIKNFDFLGGLGPVVGQGESVTITDLNSVQNNLYVNDALSYWRDFDSSGTVDVTDLNMINAHLNHTCTTPYNP
jgi:hypothetical protein